ncbi:L-threonylcarbamoyladenylate synthase [Butyrivibrio sp. INlla16]|uniref:L-threonylcarbamoyladenylate synthase n=1 Tax=Butyrivibrio sp. INlla16 TaxID=1520807 RepID=UPI00088941FC|nr:L-threonylcarbamoyladenylate synthase [Butyrivibrio sp. INlla16]SDB36221.1 L-threonylcarbamoyladenylate synthase [Butyrivibrio sp. INlla16]
MNTELIQINENNIDAAALAALQRAGTILKNGGLVAFPTETVYGLGGDALNPKSSMKIYSAKGRPSDNPLIVHVADMESIEKIVKKLPEAAYKLAEVLWPGPLTMIMEKSQEVPYETTGGLETVAIRMPSNKIAAELIRQSGGYIAAPSANLSGRPSPTEAKYCIEDLDGRVDMIIDGGQVGIGLESTIIDLTSDTPMILRPGYVTQKMLSDILGDVSIDKTILSADSGVKPKAPGMKYRHYAPKGDLTIVEGEPDKVTAYINEKISEHSKNGERTGVIATDETRDKYRADVVKCAGSREDEEEIARNLFSILRQFDDEDVKCMYSEAFDDTGLGQAIMNRLLKAAGHKVVRV